MDVLPIRYINDDDLLQVGKEIVDLAAIKRLGFPVPDGLVVLPPTIPLKETIKAFRDQSNERFESNLIIFKKKLFSLDPPAELSESLNKHQIAVDTVWKDTLSKWIEQIRSRIWRENNVSASVTDNLPAIPVFFIGKQTGSGRAYFDVEKQQIVILTDIGSTDEKVTQKLEQIVEKLRKKVVFNYVIEWVSDEKGVYLTRVRHFEVTELAVETGQKTVITSPIEKESKAVEIKTALKLYVDQSNGLIVEENADGVFLASEKIETEDQKIMKLVDSALGSGESVIFQLSDIRQKDDVSGALRLIHQPELLKQEILNYMFAKNNYTKPTLIGRSVVNQGLQHIALGIPMVHSVAELIQLKMILKGLGVDRRGNQKLWIELSIPQNWIEIDKFLETGIDGIIIDLDVLYQFLAGVNRIEKEQYYQFSPDLVLNFLEHYITRLKHKSIQILFKSEKVLEPEIVKFGLKYGLYGLILTRMQFAGAREYIAKMEKHHLIDRQVEL